jgi:alpha-L-fucosidase
MLISALLLAALVAADPPQALNPVPNQLQLGWQDFELTMFIHFTVNTFTDKEWGEGTEDPKLFNPARLDARQWVRAAKDAGFKLIIITAKHHDGFCLWPTQYTEHCVRNSAWRDGKGDVIREISDACREQGMLFGFYLSPWDRHEPTYGTDAYNVHFCDQLRELLSNYGPIAEVWFDGACGEGPNGKKQVYDWPAYYKVIRELQPNAIIWSQDGDARWIGNEDGTAGDPCWAMMGADGGMNALQTGDENGTVWRPGECDVSIRPGWFWHENQDKKLKSVDKLTDIYFQSVGRNCNLLLNVPPNQDGLFADGDVKRLAEFKSCLDDTFRTDIASGKAATASSVRGNDAAFAAARAIDGDPKTYWATDDGVTAGYIEIDFGSPSKISIASIQEYIPLGQRVKKFHMDVKNGNDWKTIASGTTIGHKRLIKFTPTTTDRVRLYIDNAKACPTISNFSLY